MLKHLQPLFDADYLLPRSFIASVDLEDLQTLIETRAIPVDACLAHLTYRLKTHKPHGYFDYGVNCNRLYDMRSGEKTVQLCVNSLLIQLQETFFSEVLVQTQWEMSYMIASQMLKKSIENKRVETVYRCVQILIHCIAMYDRIISEQKIPDDKKSTQHHDVLNESAKETIKWLETYRRWDIEMKDILDIWNTTFASVELQSENVRNSWNKNLSEGLMFNLQQRGCKYSTQMKKFVEIYCQNLDAYNPSMQECMGNIAFVAIEQGYLLDYGHFSSNENERFGRLLSRMFVSEWEKNVKQGKDESMTILRHVLRWPPLTVYLKISYNKQMKMLSPKCNVYLGQAVSVIESRITALLTGALTIGDFSLITEKDDKFSELGELLKIEKEHSAAFFRKAIEIRQKEINASQNQAEQMTTLASVCTQLAKSK
ncbi:uncharacterized protein LOC132756487 [Ruditapes philippinarum]|uniref:uncharacterized protein LOC132756487 n=1 Tax=Ruditapes philippinarum TaxID=129788 RepID=UPI00295A819D|nr:uncharacterized protein LOC132756487 [Ruditapes philippinarum]